METLVLGAHVPSAEIGKFEYCGRRGSGCGCVVGFKGDKAP